MSLSTRALIFAVTVSLTGIVITLVLGFVCLDIVHAIREENSIALRMSLVDNIINKQGAYLEKAILYTLKSGNENPFKEKYKTYDSLKTLLADSTDDTAFHQALLGMDKNQRDFHDKCSEWLEGGDLLADSMFTRGTDAVTAYKESSKRWSNLVRMLKSEADRTAKEVSQKALLSLIFIALLVGANFAILLFMLRSYTEHVSNRLEVILESASALAANQPIDQELDDSDELKKLERSLLELSHELEMSRERKQEFLAMVSHDLRSPLTMLRMTLEMMHEGIYGQPPEETKKELTQQMTRINQLISFVSDLLDIEKIDAGLLQLEKTDVNLFSVVNDAKKKILSTRKFGDSVIEITAVDKDLSGIWDKERLESAIERILAACLAYTSGILHVKLEQEKNSAPALVTIECTNSSMQFITPDVVFDRFSQSNERTKELYSEHRQSLCLARKLIRLEGGEIDFSPQAGSVRFALTLPVDIETTWQGAAYEAP